MSKFKRATRLLPSHHKSLDSLTMLSILQIFAEKGFVAPSNTAIGLSPPITIPAKLRSLTAAVQ